jgi:hypothetical protein
MIHIKNSFGYSHTIELAELHLFQQTAATAKDFNPAWMKLPPLPDLGLTQTQVKQIWRLSRPAPDRTNALTTALEHHARLWLEPNGATHFRTGSTVGGFDDATGQWHIRPLKLEAPTLAGIFSALGCSARSRGRIVLELPGTPANSVVLLPTIQDLGKIRQKPELAAETLLSLFPHWIQHGVTALQVAAIQAVLAELRGGFAAYDYTNQCYDSVAISREGSVCCNLIDTRLHLAGWDLNANRIYTEVTPDGSRRTRCRFIGPYLLPAELVPTGPQSTNENPVVQLVNWLVAVRPTFLGRQPRFVIDEGDVSLEDLHSDFAAFAASSL